MKGILLAGGTGSRLLPATRGLSKHLMLVYDKPMIYYPLSTLMLAGIRDILIICRGRDLSAFRSLLGDGSQLGLHISYAEQNEPRGIPDAFIIGASHIGTGNVAITLGDSIFYGAGFGQLLRKHVHAFTGCLIFSHQVSDPREYGVVETDGDGLLVGVEEKPASPRTDRALTGLYFFDKRAIAIAKTLKPSARGELEMVDVISAYIELGQARVASLGKGFTWLDAGTHDSLIESSHFVQTMEHKHGLRIGCIEEIALRMGYISPAQCRTLGQELGEGKYANYVVDIADQFCSNLS